MIQSGKIGYITCSNYSGWHLMKSLSTSEHYGWSKFMAHQAYYYLLDRDFERELLPDQPSEVLPTYLYWHRRQFPMLNAAPKLYGI